MEENLVVIYGHGAMAKSDYRLISPQNGRAYLYLYTFEDRKMWARVGKRIVDEALVEGRVHEPYADMKSSKIGEGSLQRDMLLSYPTGVELIYPSNLSKSMVEVKSSNGEKVKLSVYHNNANINDSSKIFVSLNSDKGKSVLLSSIIDKFNDRTRKYLWVACRSEI